MGDAYAIALVKADGKFYIKMDEGQIHGFRTVNEGLDYYQEGYMRAHTRSYEGSMSACINFIFFQPAIVQITGLEDLRQKLLDPKIPDSELRLYKVSNVSGWMDGILADQVKAQKVWEEAPKPRLI